MATAYTDLLGFALPVTGELSGTWGNVVNDSITELVEDSIAATATASVTSGDWTLTNTGGGAHNQARCAILIPTGTPGVARSILAPNSSKAYIVINQSNASVTIKGVTGPTSGATISPGVNAVVSWNGSDFVIVADSATYGDVVGPASSTDNAFARFDGTTGKLIQNSTGATLGDTGNASFAQVNISGQGDLRLEDSAGGEYVALQAPASLASSYTLTMPVDDGSANQLLTTDGNGVLSWTSPAGMSYPGVGIPVSTGSAWGTSKAAPSGDVVGTSDIQILTNKTIGMAGALDCNNNVIQEIKTATFNSQTTIVTTSGAITIDWTSAQNQKQTEPTGTITYSFTPPPGACHLQLLIDSDGTSTAQTVNWPVNVVWLNESWSGVNNKKASINFWYDGSSYYAIGSNQA